MEGCGTPEIIRRSILKLTPRERTAEDYNRIWAEWKEAAQQRRQAGVPA